MNAEDRLRLLEIAVEAQYFVEAHELLVAADGPAAALAAQRALTAQIRAEVLGEPDGARVPAPLTDVWALLKANAKAQRRRAS